MIFLLAYKVGGKAVYVFYNGVKIYFRSMATYETDLEMLDVWQFRRRDGISVPFIKDDVIYDMTVDTRDKIIACITKNIINIERELLHDISM